MLKFLLLMDNLSKFTHSGRLIRHQLLLIINVIGFEKRRVTLCKSSFAVQPAKTFLIPVYFYTFCKDNHNLASGCLFTTSKFILELSCGIKFCDKNNFLLQGTTFLF